MIERRQEIDTLHGLLKRHLVVGIIGARQVGKTTLARFFVKESHDMLGVNCVYVSMA